MDQTRSLTAVKVSVAARMSTVQDLIKDALGEIQKYRAWSETFPAALQAARRVSEDIPDGFVWQDEFVSYWTPFDAIQRKLFVVVDELESKDPKLARELDPFLDPPKKAQIEFATSDPKFLNVGSDRAEIAYEETQLRRWHQNFSRWVNQSTRVLKNYTR